MEYKGEEVNKIIYGLVQMKVSIYMIMRIMLSNIPKTLLINIHYVVMMLNLL